MNPRDDLSAPRSGPATREAPDAARAAAGTAPPITTPPVWRRSAPSRRKVILGIVAAIVLLFGAYQGIGWMRTGRFIVSTDDAYAQADVTIMAAKATGYVATIEVAPNAAVAAGQVIARLDDVDYRLAVQAAKDKLATQTSAVERIGRQIEAAEAQVGQAVPQIAAARADVVRTKADFERQTRLSQSDFASKARFEQALADRDRADATTKGAEAALKAAEANVAVLRAQRSEAERVAAEYRTAVDKAERDLSFTVVRAPVAGIVGNRAVEVGSYVQPGTRLAALVPLESVHVDANFKETQLAAIRPGMAAEIRVDAFPDRVFHGKVESLAPATGSQFSLLPPENATGNFTKIVQRVPVRIGIEPRELAEGRLRPGLSVVARIDIRTGPPEASAR